MAISKTMLRVGMTVLLCEEGFPIQRAEVLEIDLEQEVLTVCIVKADRAEDDEDGLCGTGFEDIQLLIPIK